MIDVEMYIHQQTDVGIFASHTGEVDNAVWLPLLLVEITPIDGQVSVTVTMPNWLAQREGLI